MENLGILIGYGFDFELGGKNQISSALKSNGYYVKEIDTPWPRNDYVYINGNYIFEENKEENSPNPLGNGGMVQKGGDFVLFSNSMMDYDHFDLSKKEIIEKGKKEFNSRVYIVPVGEANGDIDMYTLLLPKRKIMIFDKYFGKDANKGFSYNQVAEKEDFKFIKYDAGKMDPGVWYPLNSLVLEKNGKDVVVLDKNSKSLIKILEKEGVGVIPIDMPQRINPAGKINCQTNVFEVKDEKKILRYLNE